MGEIIGLEKRLREDGEFLEKWNQMSAKAQNEMREIDAGERVPNMLSDVIFKSIFHPDKEPKRLSAFLSSILNRQVEVIGSLDKEGIHRSEKSKGIILDILARFENGEIAELEMQRVGRVFPSQRSVVYFAELVARQYAIAKGQKKSDVSYSDVKPVYTIILMEESTPEFWKTEKYIHHFSQKSDTGLELELLQYYDYVCLDIFTDKHPRLAGELEKWLTFLSIKKTSDMKDFLKENPGFQFLYDNVIMMLSDREEMLCFMVSIIENEDVMETVRSSIKYEVRQLEKQLAEINEQIQEKNEQLEERDEQIQEKDEQLQERDEQIQEKDKLIADKDAEILKLRKELEQMRRR